MVTKKTRLASALLAVLMVVSMCAMFALPAVAETSEAQGYIDELAKYKNGYEKDFDLFDAATAAKMQAAYDAATAALEDETKLADAKTAYDAAMVTADWAVNTGAYPYIPRYADKAAWDATGLFVDKANYAITTKEDWIAAVSENKNTFSGITLHLTQNVDMENTDVDPLSFNANFQGTLNGHGYAFENFYMYIPGTYTGNYGVGLVSTLDGVLTDVGLESGLILAVYAPTGDAAYGIGGLVGQTKWQTTKAKLVRCWNNATVVGVVTGSGNTAFSIGGIVGRFQGQATIDSCYNSGTVIGNGHASGLSDWLRDCVANSVLDSSYGPNYVYNSFSTNKLYGNSTYMMRPASDKYKLRTEGYPNNYAVGVSYDGITDKSSYSFTTAEYEVAIDKYETGELAYMMNQGYVSGKGTHPYYTIKDGVIALGTEATQVRKVTLDYADESVTDEVYYLAGGSTFALPADNTYEGLDGNILTVSSTADMTVNVTNGTVSYAELRSALAFFNGKDAKYFSITADRLAAIEAQMATGFADQAAIDAAAAEVTDGQAYNGKTLPAITQFGDYPDAPGYNVGTVAEMEVAVALCTRLTSAQTIYLTADLDLSNATAAVVFHNMGAAFDGQNHVLSNWSTTRVVTEKKTGTATGLFTNYHGKSVKNVTLSKAKVISNNRDTGLFMGGANSSNLTIENVHLIDCTLELNNDTTIGTIYGSGLLLGESYTTSATINIKNCSIKDSKMTSTSTGYTDNTGLLIGVARSKCTWNLTDIVLQNNSLEVNTDGTTSFLIGAVETEGGTTLNANNIVLLGNTRTNGVLGWTTRSLLIGQIKGGSNVSLNNVVIGADNDQSGYTESSSINSSKTLAGWLAYNPISNIQAENPTKGGTVTYTNVYNYVAFNGEDLNRATRTDCMENITAQDYGEIAYKLNSNSTVTANGTTLTANNKWRVNAAGQLEVAADDTGLPLAVTLEATDAINTGRTLSTVRYTNVNGTLIALGDCTTSTNDTVNLLSGVDWESDITTAFTEEKTVNGVLKTVDPYWTVTAPEGAKGGDTVTLTFGIQNNPGIYGADIIVTYDKDEMTYVSGSSNMIADGVFGACIAKDNGDGTVTVKLTAANEEDGNDYAENGALFSLQFQINAETYGGEFNVSIKTDPTESETVEGVVNANGDKITVYETGCSFDVESTLRTLVVENTEGYQGRDVEVAIKMKNNEGGVNGGTMNVTYDPKALTFKEVVSNSAVPAEGGEPVVDDETGLATVKVTMISNQALTGDATLATLKFTVNDDAPVGNTTVSVAADETDGFILVEGDDPETATEIPVKVMSGEGTVAVSDVLPGDVNSDGKVTIGDAVLTLRIAVGDDTVYQIEGVEIDKEAADVCTVEGEEAGKVTVADVIQMLKYLNGSITTL